MDNDTPSSGYPDNRWSKAAASSLITIRPISKVSPGRGFDALALSY